MLLINGFIGYDSSLSFRVFMRTVCLFSLLALPSLVIAGEHADFNGDGYEDLAIGVPGEDVDGVFDAGAVQVFYGNAVSANQLWHLNSPNIRTAATAGDRLGSALATGDFNGDGYADLAVGVPFKDNNKGQVLVLYGSASGLTEIGHQVWDQGNLVDTREAGDQFGSALVAGDFNADGYADLAIGVPKEDFPDIGPPATQIPRCGICPDAGVVNLVYGSASGLTAVGNELWHQDRGISFDGWVEWQDCFGASLETGDFDGNGADDLAVGAVCEQTGGAGEGAINNGAVSVYYGTPGVGLTGSGAVYLRQWFPDVAGWPQKDDAFGYALASSDFNHDGFADLAIGIPGEEDDCSSLTDAGAVAVFYGKSGVGVTPTDASRNELWCRNSAGIQGSGTGRWGASLAAGDFNDDGYADIAIAAPLDEVGGVVESGSVSILYGSKSRLSSDGNQFLTQSTPGVDDTAEQYDWFGDSLTSLDFNGDSVPDLAIGLPFENLSGVINAGAVNLLFGAPGIGITTANDRFLHQNGPGVVDVNETENQFGGRLLPHLYNSPWLDQPAEGIDNQPPVWEPVPPKNGEEGQLLSFNISAVDSDGPAPLVLKVEHLPVGATFGDLGSGTGEFVWTPPLYAAAASPYVVVFTATDEGGDGLSSSVNVTVNVSPPPQPPVLTPIDAQSVTEEQALVFQVRATDDDGPPPLVLSVANAPNSAQFTDFGDGTGEFHWTPAAGTAANSPYAVTIEATDDGGAGLSDSQTVTITVIPAPTDSDRSTVVSSSGGGGGGCTIGTEQTPNFVFAIFIFIATVYLICRREHCSTVLMSHR